MATTAFRASRVDMLQGGVPTDYVDALLDDRYMADLIERTNQRMGKRADKMKNYFLMQKLIFWILCAQALLGIWVALYKTLLQPDIIWGANADLENVDLVLMLDASRPTSHAMHIQHLAARNFTGMLQNAMLENKRNLKEREKARILEKQSEDSVMASLLPFLRYIRPKQPKGLIKVKGGGLRVATGIFNAERAELLHDFSGNISVQQEALASVGEDAYRSVAFWLPALDVCRQAAAHAGEKHARYCAIIGDDSAMCTRVVAKPVRSHCRKWPQLCPPEADLEFLGDGFLEYAREMDTCTTFVRDQMDAAPAMLKTIMMFTVGSAEEGQLRLKNPGFQSFIKATTECEITKRTVRLEGEDGSVSVVERFEEDDNCVRFIMGNGFDDLMSKSARIADLLKDTSQEFSMTNDGHDPRYILFLLLPLNLLFYLLWSKILRCTDRIKTQTERAMGRKRKVVKVTKFLVEKPEPPPTVLQQRHAQLSEVELADLASLRPLVEFGAPMTLRARLKGGYLRADPQAGVPDGNGHAFDPMSNWTFEHVGDADGEGGHGHRVRVRNARGELLVADEAGTRFVPAPAEGAAPGEDGAAGAAAEFVLEQAEGDAACHLGDAVQLLSCGTGGYLRVQKDGTCDAKGGASDHETQFVVDRGGATVSSGSVVTLSSALTGGFMRGTPSGDVTALPGGEEWRFWKIEKKADAGEGGQERAEGQAAAAPAAPHAQLKQGDVIMLTAFNQHKLEIGKDGRVRCGGPSAGAMETVREDEEGRGEAAPEAQLSQEFVIERVGMGTVRKQDNTLRAGMQVCLRPLQQGARGSGEEDAGGPADYLRVNGDGSVSPDGKVSQREITLTMDLAKMSDMVLPLHGTLQKGDVDLLVSPLWNKADIKKVNAMSSNWTNEEDLAQFKGPVVVASDKGTYAVPKAKGVDSGWVAVVNEGVDIRKAARQAKLQGATGLIVRCEDVLSLEKMARKGGAAAAPELPAVFVDQAAGEQLDERGIVLNGCEFRKRYVTDAVRALGSIAAHHASGAGGGDQPDVFRALGQGMLEQDRERQEAAEAQAAAGTAAQEEEADGNYKWKVTSNTHYLWGKSGGGAAKMDVNFGSAAPPSAVQRTKLYADASGSRQRRPSAPEVAPRRSVTGVAVLEADDVKSRRLVSQLSTVLRAEEVSASEPLEQLAEESDFKIEYKFEEVEVAAGEQLEEVEEQEIMGEQEAVIAKFGVPRKRFWLVATGLLLSTTLLVTFLCYSLFTEFPVQDLPGFEEEEEALAAPGPGPLLPLARLASFLAA